MVIEVAVVAPELKGQVNYICDPEKRDEGEKKSAGSILREIRKQFPEV